VRCKKRKIYIFGKKFMTREFFFSGRVKPKNLKSEILMYFDKNPKLKRKTEIPYFFMF